MSKSPAGDGGRAKRGAFLFGRTRGLFIANKLPFVLGAAVLFAAMGVVAANTGGSSTPATSALTSTVVAAVSPAAVISAAASVPVISTLPVISGVAQVGQTLTTTNGTWANSPTSLTYQWNRAGAAISGAAAFELRSRRGRHWEHADGFSNCLERERPKFPCNIRSDGRRDIVKWRNSYLWHCAGWPDAHGVRR